MTHLLEAIPFTIGAIVVIALLNTIGAITSRRFNYKYAWLSVLSFSVYSFIGYSMGPRLGISIAILCSLVVGFFDATAGWKISKLLKANFGIPDEFLEKLTVQTNLTVMLFVAPFFSFSGYLLYRLLH